MVFFNYSNDYLKGKKTIVTILILIDGFLQLQIYWGSNLIAKSHNPYFNRWFSAIEKTEKKTDIVDKSQSLF